MSKAKYKLDIKGLMAKMVVVSKVLDRKIENKNQYHATVKWEDYNLPHERTGWVTGIRTLNNGEIISGSGSIFDSDSEGSEFKTISGVRCLLVCFWPTEKPVFVPLDGFKVLAWKEDPFTQPHRTTWRDCVADSEEIKREELIEANFKKDMREHMANVPRDKKGRWMRGNAWMSRS